MIKNYIDCTRINYTPIVLLPKSYLRVPEGTRHRDV